MVPAIAHHFSSANGHQIHVLILIPITLPNGEARMSVSKVICL